MQLCLEINVVEVPRLRIMSNRSRLPVRSLHTCLTLGFINTAGADNTIRLPHMLKSVTSIMLDYARQ